MDELRFKQLHRAASAALSWYRAHARNLPWRKEPTPYRIWLSEIIFQQTRIEAGTAYYLRFLEEAPDVQALAEMEEEKLMKLWQGLGYYARARNLQKAARIVLCEYGGALPEEEKELKALPGIGSYTAGAIASIAFGKAVPAVDGNVLRVLSRIFAREDDIARPETKKALETELRAFYVRFFENASANAGDLNQAWMDIGAAICLPNGAPRCKECPFRDFCEAHRTGREMDYPVKARPRARTVEERTVFVIRRETQGGESDRSRTEYLVRKRPEKGLLSGLWELPNESGFFTEEEANALLSVKYRLSERALRLEALPDAKHVFSHIEWRMKGYLCDVEAGTFETENEEAPAQDYEAAIEKDPLSERAVWKTAQAIAEECAIPSAFRTYRKAIV